MIPEGTVAYLLLFHHHTETWAFADLPAVEENMILSLSATGTAQRVLGGSSGPRWQQGLRLGSGMCGPVTSGSAVLEEGTG